MKISKTILILTVLSFSSIGFSAVVQAQNEYGSAKAAEAFDNAVFNSIDFDMIFDDFDFSGLSGFDTDETLTGDDISLENIMVAGDHLLNDYENTLNYQNRDYPQDLTRVAQNNEDPESFVPYARNFGDMDGEPGEGIEMMPFDHQNRFRVTEGPGMGGKGMIGRGLGRGMREGMGRDFFEAMKDNLGLNDDQIKQFRTKHLEFVKNTSKTRADLQVARLELKYLLDEKEPDISAVEKKMQDVNALSTSLKITALKNKNESRKILTDDQRAKLDEMKKGMPGRGQFMERKNSKENKGDGSEKPGKKHNM